LVFIVLKEKMVMRVLVGTKQVEKFLTLLGVFANLAQWQDQ